MSKRAVCAVILLALSMIGSGWSAPVAFNDPTLLNAVKVQWEAATGLTLSNPPEDTELANPLFSQLAARDLGISDLTGLEACTSLTDLNVGVNQIADITPLSSLTSLTKLDLGFGINLFEMNDNLDATFTGTNLISDISPLAGLVNLEYLSLTGNTALSCIDTISAMSNLSILWLAANPISDFSPLADRAESMFALAIINCGLKQSDLPVINSLHHLKALCIDHEPNITDISSLTGFDLTLAFILGYTGVEDLSVVTHYTNLQMLEVEGNPVTTIPNLSGLASLQFIEFTRNQITDISGFNGLSGVPYIGIEFNQISDISALASCTGLTKLDLSDNQITNVDALASCTMLQTLDISSNNITDISALASCINLKKLEIQKNQITGIQPLLDNSGIANLQFLDMGFNEFYAGSPFCEENQLAQLTALAPTMQIQQDAVCGETYNLTITVNGTGNTSPEPGVHRVARGNFTTIYASPSTDSGWAFEHWAGDGIGTGTAISVLMDADKTVEAVFTTPGDHTLVVQKTGTGMGKIFPTPGNYSFMNGQTVMFSAFPLVGSFFGGWQGDITGYTVENVPLTMDSDKTVAARFVSTGFTLYLTVYGNGFIQNFHNRPLIGYVSGAVVDLQAVALIDSQFDHWEGDIDSENPLIQHIQVTMNQNRYVTAIFVPAGEGEGMPPEGSQEEGEGSENGEGEGAIEGEGGIEGIPEEGQPEGVIEGHEEGQFEGAMEGVEEGALEGEGLEEGDLEGVIEGSSEGLVEGEGVEEGAEEGEGTFEGEGATEGDGEGGMEGQEEGDLEGGSEGSLEGLVEGEGGEEGEGSFEGEGMPAEGSLEEGEGGEGEGECGVIVLPGDVPLFMAWIPAGTFRMGRNPGGEQDSDAVEDPQHLVTVPGFWMGTYELTQAQWMAVMGTAPWSGQAYVIDDPNSPAVWVSWEDAQSFIIALNTYTHLTFRLPSEAEWEYACRARTTTRFYWGDDPDYTVGDEYAWWYGNAQSAGERYAHGVGMKLPNTWGLYDMSGNAYEWCQDWWHDDYTGAPNDGSAWETPASLYRVLRGGAWGGFGFHCRSANRDATEPDYAVNLIGFRLAAASLGCEAEGEGLAEGVIEGITEGTEEGDGVEEGQGEGMAEGLEEGSAEGQLEGEGHIEGSVEGEMEGTPVEGDEEGVIEGEVEGQAEGVFEGMEEGQGEGEVEGTPVEGDEEGGVEDGLHTADQNGDNQIGLSELLRVIQFYNSGGYHCDAAGEDGYAPGPGDQTCAPHDSDYQPRDWRIGLSELLRIIQFYNSGGYHYCPEEGSEDGFCPGVT